VRAGRFSKVADLTKEPTRVLSIPQLLIVDLISAGKLTNERIAYDRAAMLTHSAAFLILAHLVAATLIFLTVAGSDGPSMDSAWTAVLLVALLVLDAGFWMIARMQRNNHMAPWLIVQLAAGYCLGSGLLLTFMVDPALAAGDGNPIIYATIAAALVLTIPAFLSIPFLVLEGYLVGIAGLALLGAPVELLGTAGAIGGSFLWFSLVSARDYILMASRRISSEWQAEKACRFVTQFEQSGQGWFWETNAQGELLYVSDQLADDLKRDPSELLGTRFTDLLSVDSFPILRSDGARQHRRRGVVDDFRLAQFRRVRQVPRLPRYRHRPYREEEIGSGDQPPGALRFPDRAA
jgi:hypothetical protein